MGLRDLLMNHGMAEGGLDLPDVLNALAKGAVLVDVRTAREYEAGHAPGAGSLILRSCSLTPSPLCMAMTRWLNPTPISSWCVTRGFGPVIW